VLRRFASPRVDDSEVDDRDGLTDPFKDPSVDCRGGLEAVAELKPREGRPEVPLCPLGPIVLDVNEAGG
jgi:hypothetical protein